MVVAVEVDDQVVLMVDLEWDSMEALVLEAVEVEDLGQVDLEMGPVQDLVLEVVEVEDLGQVALEMEQVQDLVSALEAVVGQEA